MKSEIKVSIICIFAAFTLKIMWKYLLLLFFVGNSQLVVSQKLQVTAIAGLMNYQGDLQEKKFTLEQGKAAFGIGAYYEISDRFMVRANIISGSVSAADNFGTNNKSRNLSFSSPITEFHLGIEYDLLNIYENMVTPYAFFSVGFFQFKPSAINAAGNKVFLQPLGTEGQGFYQGRKKYGLTQIAIPFGAGIKMAMSDNAYLRLEAGLRYLLTDYLDDVSTTFVDKAALLANNGQLAVDMAFRSAEIKPAAVYPGQGAIRGNPKVKDMYYIIGISVSYRLPTASGYSSKKLKGNVGCPVNF